MTIEISMDEIERRAMIEHEVNTLAEEATELGIVAEDIFKDAVAALFGPERELAQGAMAGGQLCARSYAAIHQHALNILGRTGLTGDHMRRVVELQQSAAEFTRIAEHSGQLAEHALTLGGGADPALRRGVRGDPMLLRRMVRRAYLQVRGAVIVCASRDTSRARALAAEDAELDQLFRELREALADAIARSPLSAFPLQQVLLIGAQLEEIGNRVVAICRTVLYTSPPTSFGR